AQVLDQAAIHGGFEFRARLLVGSRVGSHDLLRGLGKGKIERRTACFHRSSRTPMAVQSQALLESLFRAAVAAAHPWHCLPPHLPEPPTGGRLILLAAGKGGGSLIEVAEAYYLQVMPPKRLSGIAVTRHGYGRPTKHIPVVEAGHPVPDAAGLAGAERM